MVEAPPTVEAKLDNANAVPLLLIVILVIVVPALSYCGWWLHKQHQRYSRYLDLEAHAKAERARLAEEDAKRIQQRRLEEKERLKAAAAKNKLSEEATKREVAKREASAMADTRHNHGVRRGHAATPARVLGAGTRVALHL